MSSRRLPQAIKARCAWTTWRAILLWALWSTPVNAETIVHKQTSLYHQIYVVEDGVQRCLRFGPAQSAGFQSCMIPRFPDELVFSYIRMMLGALYLQPDPHKILVIGLGGGSLPRALAQLYPTASIDIVEIDPVVVIIARAYFAFQPTDRQRVFTEDGRVFVQRAMQERHHYDLILLDAFSGTMIPEHLTAQEFLTAIKGILAPQGVIAVNTVPRAALYDHESVTYESVFGNFFNLRDGGNRVIIAAKDGLPPMETLRANAARLDERLSRFGVDSNWFFPYLRTTRDWDPQVRILTDQYTPSNLLNTVPTLK